jgi:hypothetical protein
LVSGSGLVTIARAMALSFLVWSGTSCYLQLYFSIVGPQRMALSGPNESGKTTITVIDDHQVEF